MIEKKQEIKFLQWIRPLILGVVIFFLIRIFIFSNYVVEGKSMMPTLQEGNMLVVSKFTYQFEDLKRFDIIVFKEDDEILVKRVIGLPGDKVAYKNDTLYINDKKVEEPFLQVNKEQALGTKITGDFTLTSLTGEDFVPISCLFVIGDNRLLSLDSRHFGFVKCNQVIGKVNFRYWPLNKIDISF